MSKIESQPLYDHSLSAGRLLQLEIDERDISQGELAEAIGVTRQTISAAVNGRTAISKSLSAKLGTYFEQPPDHWRNLSITQDAVRLTNNLDLRATSAILVDFQILEAVETGEISLSDFNEKRLRQASYDCTIGSDAYDLVSGASASNPGLPLQVEPGQILTLLTLERICLHNGYVGRVGGTTDLGRFGLILNHGLQVDPGFDGHLQFSVFNPTTVAVPIEPGCPVLSIEIHRLPTAPERDFTQAKGTFEQTRKDHNARLQRKFLTEKLTGLVGEMATMEQIAEGVRIEFPGLPNARVVEQKPKSAIEHVARYIAHLIFCGFHSAETADTTHFRDELENINLNRKQIETLYAELGVTLNIAAGEALISADWFDGERDALLCSHSGMKPLVAVLEAISFSDFLSQASGQ